MRIMATTPYHGRGVVGAWSWYRGRGIVELVDATPAERVMKKHTRIGLILLPWLLLILVGAIYLNWRIHGLNLYPHSRAEISVVNSCVEALDAVELQAVSTSRYWENIPPGETRYVGLDIEDIEALKLRFTYKGRRFLAPDCGAVDRGEKLTINIAENGTRYVLTFGTQLGATVLWRTEEITD